MGSGAGGSVMCFSATQDKFSGSVTEKFKTRVGVSEKRRTTFACCFHSGTQKFSQHKISLFSIIFYVQDTLEHRLDMMSHFSFASCCESLVP